MVQDLLSVYGAMLVGAVIGAVVGFGVEQAIGQEGWALLIGAAGMCAGAFWAAIRRADGKLPWPSRRRDGSEPAPADRSA